MSWDQTKLRCSSQTHTSDDQSFSQSIQKPIEVYLYIDPFCCKSWQLEPYIKKLVLEYGHHLSIRPILSKHLITVRNSPNETSVKPLKNEWTQTIQRSSDGETLSPWMVLLSIKAAELQGKTAGHLFLRYIQQYLQINKNQTLNETHLIKCARLVQLDMDEFQKDLFSSPAKRALKCDFKLAREMKIKETPSVVFFNPLIDEEGIKVQGLYTYDIYVHVLEKLLQNKPIKNSLPSLIDFIQKYKIVSTKEISIIYNWSIKKTTCELKKLQLQQVVERNKMKDDESYWTYIQ